MRKITIEKSTLEDMLTRMTPASVAKQLGVSRNTVSRRMKELGLSSNFLHKPTALADVLTEEYFESIEDTHTYKDIMEELGVSKSVVFKYARMHGVKLKVEKYVGEKHPRWKGGEYIRDTGATKYKIVSTHRDDKGTLQYRREHCLIMEKHIGRKMKKGEVVHHVDGNGLNNDIDNLLLLTSKEHDRLHHVLGLFQIDYRNLTKQQCELLVSVASMGEIRSFIKELLNRENVC